MHLKGNNNWRLFLTALIMWSGTVSGCFAQTTDAVDVKPFADGWVKARANGTLVWTDADGNATDSVRLKMEIAGIDVQQDKVLAVSPDCMIYSVDRSGRSRRLCRSQMRGSGDRVVGMASSKENTLILTRDGVILSTVGFDTFTTMDFNGTYYSYYDETLFCSIAASDNSFFIAGIYMNGKPAVFTSATGKIWSERTLTYTENGQTLQLELQPVRLSYDRSHERFVMSCADGWLFYMPGCSHCNSLTHE